MLKQGGFRLLPGLLAGVVVLCIWRLSTTEADAIFEVSGYVHRLLEVPKDYEEVSGFTEQDVFKNTPSGFGLGDDILLEVPASPDLELVKNKVLEKGVAKEEALKVVSLDSASKKKSSNEDTLGTLSPQYDLEEDIIPEAENETLPAGWQRTKPPKQLPKKYQRFLDRFNSEECRKYRFRPSGLGKDRRLGAYGRAKCNDEINSTTYLQERGSQVLISHAYKMIYISNMKVASLLFKKLFKDRYEGEPLGTHNLAEVLRKQREFDPDFDLNDYFVFTFVRDPVSIFFSAYSEIDLRMTRGVRNNNTDFQKLNRTLDMEPLRTRQCLEMVRTGRRLSRSLTPKHMNSQIWKTQRCVLVENEPLPVQLELDFVGRLENLKEDWFTLETILGLEHKRLFRIHSQQTLFKDHAKLVKGLHDKDLEKEICDYYESDYACFPYVKPAHCS
uniref:Carbohydrate sulfotransferase n=1 Tax=Mucochytrium quahogii TaxID=96639 RepID=A0A7S2S3A1_9STRA|mmetsp:Transcript_5007/g.7597  ORF Transcript_5007/g.7597 Transcript_5007/m.7597 type:complete len:444 (-) Transcript_5007:960-2291(-)|eukprot:CAMPEP_0203747350 /NCGR_PEP_ID=MMETSP0098-20131031/2529_1 /ASSEMBLY_ACC=CAM_ASM_000208 /TAXON_ID=96639 /ORGANISM=" , Strain NY0313808BC1" /LENGTH=443 /DNA_ID=CAMNT_0050635749 /DNA_START=357 /DNA_END=1688 /DNA_ORIENTATION=+